MGTDIFEWRSLGSVHCFALLCILVGRKHRQLCVTACWDPDLQAQSHREDVHFTRSLGIGLVLNHQRVSCPCLITWVERTICENNILHSQKKRHIHLLKIRTLSCIPLESADFKPCVCFDIFYPPFPRLNASGQFSLDFGAECWLICFQRDNQDILVGRFDPLLGGTKEEKPAEKFAHLKSDFPSPPLFFPHFFDAYTLYVDSGHVQFSGRFKMVSRRTCSPPLSPLLPLKQSKCLFDW